MQVKAYGAATASSPLMPMVISRREPAREDVLIDILYCGVCHTDIGYARGHYASVHPLVPGHEIVGRVAQVGPAVTRFRPGELVGVGCLVDSCRTCANCREDLEPYCPGALPTYAGLERDGTTVTQGGYSKRITVDQRFVLRIPRGMDPAAAAPLLCAGITTYSALRQAKASSHSHVAILGLGGLGHLAVRLAKAMGAHVTVLSRSDEKRAAAARLGADDYIATGEPDWAASQASRFDLMLDTVSGSIDWDACIGTLKRDGALVMLGIPDAPITTNALGLIMQRRSLLGSLIGGMRQTQEMLDFCAEHGICADIELIPIQKINEAFERVLESDVRYRFVIDMASLV